MKNRSLLTLGAGVAIGLLVGAGMMIGTVYTLNSADRTADFPLPETLLHATASHSGESMAMATGRIDSDVEGLFALDYLTGELQCFVVNPRNPQGGFGGIFKHNVVTDLGVEQGKKPNYILLTGGANFLRGGGISAPAECIVYVADANSGHFACYGLPWNRTAVRANQPQLGSFILLGKGMARNLDLRE